jgi:hypothetical protein
MEANEFPHSGLNRCYEMRRSQPSRAPLRQSPSPLLDRLQGREMDEDADHPTPLLDRLRRASANVVAPRNA